MQYVTVSPGVVALLLLEISINVLALRSVRGRTKPLHVTGEDDRAFALQSVTSSGLGVWIVQPHGQS